ncbi:uncharacterized protein LOC128220223 [Mya arenaria]|uniref:uncharacterized protein LOC128220223 n=1 Tax=Mya arenaria TaxID=6604 RepID=UPI0022DED6AB|nr:uncharacterized protein LOC128220223 [Mya arenaria]
MQSSKFNRKPVRRTLTQINTSTTQNFPKTRATHDTNVRSSNKRETVRTESNSQDYRPYYSSQASSRGHAGPSVIQSGQIVQHVMIPVPVPVGSEINPSLFTSQIITAPLQAPVSINENSNSSYQEQDSRHSKLNPADDLNYYLSKDNSAKKEGRNYRRRQDSGSPDSYSSSSHRPRDKDLERYIDRSPKRRERSRRTYGPVRERDRYERDIHNDNLERHDRESESRNRYSDYFRDKSPVSSRSYSPSTEISMSSRERYYREHTREERSFRRNRSRHSRSRSIEQSRGSYHEQEHSRESYHARNEDRSREERPRSHSRNERRGGAVLFEDEQEVKYDNDERKVDYMDHEEHDTISDIFKESRDRDGRERDWEHERHRDIDRPRELDTDLEEGEYDRRDLIENDYNRDLRESELDRRERELERIRELEEIKREHERERELEEEEREHEIIRQLKEKERELEIIRDLEERERMKEMDDYREREVHDLERRSIHSRGSSVRQRETEQFSRSREHSQLSEHESYGKRRLSPVSLDRVSSRSSKLRRDLSPVSVSMSHDDLKIHVSDQGRWIETEKHENDLSSVSDEFEMERKSHDYNRTMVDDKVYVANDGHKSNEDYLDATDLVSDDEVNYKDENFDYFKKGFEKDRHTDLKSENQPHKHKEVNSSTNLKIPNVCTYYQNTRKGCNNPQCGFLHVCKAMVLENCRYGPKCVKSHDFLSNQPFELLKKQNPNEDLRSQNFYWKIIGLLQKRILVECGRTDLIPVIEEKQQARLKAVEESKSVTKYASGPGHDLRTQIDHSKRRTYTENKQTDYQTKRETVEKSVSYKNVTGVKQNKNKHSVDARNPNEEKDQKSRAKYSKDSAKEQNKDTSDISDDKEDLSSVSGDEGNWEEYEKYEKVSDAGMSNKGNKDDEELDNVSSCGSHESDYRAIEFSGPAPVPENIAVPIGMNDPLVFNRPLGSKLENYVGPLNRPPPGFPINPAAMGRGPPNLSQPPPGHMDSHQVMGMNRPPSMGIFPIPPPNPNLQMRGQNMSMFRQNFPVGGHNIPPGSILPGATNIHGNFGGPNIRPMMSTPPLPSHLPSPEFMKQVIQCLPKNTFKNENTPAIVEAKEDKKKKVELNPELKETIKSVWKFPQKTQVNMSVIEFVTETEAYKEEFISEIIRILVNLQLPYVTMKKLISVIKEKVMINIKSEVDLRKILDMYPSNFQIEEQEDSDDEDEKESKKLVKIKANVTLGFCEKHGFLPFAIGKCECNALHVCKFYFLSRCPNKHCKFGHKLKTEHNIGVLKNHKLHRLTGEEIMIFLRDVENRNKETVPAVCKYYIREKSCYKGDNTDFDTICHGLHMCQYAVKNRCTNKECEKSHSIRDIQPNSLLVKYGLDPDELGDGKVMTMLKEVCLASDKEKEKTKKSFRGKESVKTVQKPGGVLTKNKNSTEKAHSSKVTTKNMGTGMEDRIKKKISDLGQKIYSIPAVCKFYQNEMGCRKRDWGLDGKCHFLHICQYFVIGECKFEENCKRSHDLFSGQTSETLKKYNIDTDVFDRYEILELLRKSSDAPIAIPQKEEERNYEVIENKDADHHVKQTSAYKEAIKKAQERMLIEKDDVEEQGNVEEMGSYEPMNIEAATAKSILKNKIAKHVESEKQLFQSCNIEDVIKHIMEEKKVDLTKNQDRCYGEEGHSGANIGDWESGHESDEGEEAETKKS